MFSKSPSLLSLQSATTLVLTTLFGVGCDAQSAESNTHERSQAPADSQVDTDSEHPEETEPAEEAGPSEFELQGIAQALSWSVSIATRHADLFDYHYSERGNGTFRYGDDPVHSVEGSMSGEWSTLLPLADHEMTLYAELDVLGVDEDRFSGPLTILAQDTSIEGCQGTCLDFQYFIDGAIETSVGDDISVDLTLTYDFDDPFEVDDEPVLRTLVEYQGTLNDEEVSGEIELIH